MSTHAARFFFVPLTVAAIAAGIGGCTVRRAIAQASGEAIRDRLAQRSASNGTKTDEVVEIAGLSVSVWRPQAAAGPAPLVIFSHGFHGSSTQSTFLMKALANHGYLVLAPNHRDATRAGADIASWKPEEGFANPGAWSADTYRDRATDIRSLIRALQIDAKWSAAVDWSRVALAGHSLGGYTVLGLAGGWPSWKLPEVKAVLALSPYCAPFVEKRSLGSLQVPVMYQGGTLDFGITPFVKQKSGAYDLTPAPACFVEFRRAGHLAWTDLNPTFQSSIVHYSVAFLDRYLKADSGADPFGRRPDVAELRSK